MKKKSLLRVVISIIAIMTLIVSIIPEIKVLADDVEVEVDADAVEEITATSKIATTSAETEQELISIIKRLGEENIIFENAIGIEIGQEIEVLNLLSIDESIELDGIKLTSNNEDILTIINDETIVGVNEGTTFLIGEISEKYHVLEVYVAHPDKELSNNTSNSIVKNVGLQDTEYIGEDFLEVASGLRLLNPRNVIYSNFIGKDEHSMTLSNLLNSITSSHSIKNLNTTSSRTQYLVYVDAGHGGSDPGAVANGIREKDINLAIALKVRDKLRALGVQVVMNRETDVFVAFQDTAAHANSVKPDAFISIHANAATAAAHGIETYYNKSIDLPLANEVHSRLISYTGANNRGVKWNEFYVTKHTTMPAILTEVGFVTNATEAAKLNTNSYQNTLANAITDGAIKYLKDNVRLSLIPSERIFGLTRYETSYKVFEKGWATSQTAILVTGLDYPDALCAAPLAGKYDAPILLVRNQSLSQQTELRNLLVNKGVKNVFIIGGTGVIPKVVETELTNIGINYKRLGGINRFETSSLIADEVGSSGEVVIASGRTFADGLSISSIAAKKGMPILLTEANSMPSSIKSFLDKINVTRTYVVGGTGVLTPSLVSTLKNPLRLAGADRYETNRQIFENFKSELDLSVVYMASAIIFPDALASSAIAARNNNFVILSDTTAARVAVKGIINTNKSSITRVNILGSNKVITDAVLDQLEISR